MPFEICIANPGGAALSGTPLVWGEPHLPQPTRSTDDWSFVGTAHDLDLEVPKVVFDIEAQPLPIIAEFVEFDEMKQASAGRCRG